MAGADIHSLQQAIGYTFKNEALLREALAHPSLSSTRGSNNQRLEFLGDAVLGAVVAELLYALYPTEAEGELARRHAALVRGETLADVSRELGLGEYLHMAASEESAGGRQQLSNLEDALEALVGAIFLDGGYAAAQAFLRPRWQSMAAKIQAPPKDAKTALQEWAQGRGLPVPEYRVVSSVGPAHAPVFTIEASVQGHAPTKAEAASKRAAEQLAAAALLKAVSA